MPLRTRDEARLLEHRRILQSLDRILHLYFESHDISEATAVMLEEALALTDSEYGLIGEIARDAHKRPYLRVLAALDISQKEPTEEDFATLDRVCQQVLAGAQVVLFDGQQASSRPRAHAPDAVVMHSFLGVPLFHGDEMIAMFGLANRPEGYTEELNSALSPFYSTVGNIIHSYFLASHNLWLSDRHSSLLQNIPGVSYRCLCDSTWTMLFISQAIEELSGYPAHEFVNNIARTYASIIHPDDQGHIAAAVDRAVAARAPWEVEYRIISRRGQVKYVFERGRGIFDSRGAKFRDGFILDITDKKAAERERVRFVAELEQARDDAEVAMRAKANFLSVMSHEIRTPLNGIVGAIEILSDLEHPDAEARALFSMIDASCEHLAELLGNILDYSKIDDGKLQLSEKPIDLAQLCEQICQLFDQAAAEQDVHLSVTSRLKQPMYHGDDLRIRQIVSNLISNAIKFTQRGQVETSLFERAERVCIAVRDTGIGIASDNLEHIFGDFNQLDSSLTRRFDGTGLGLAISRRLAELMGGTLTCESVEGRGSTFTFAAPLRPCRPSMAAQKPPAERHYHARILMAEDNPVNQKILRRLLLKMGLDVDVARNGREAWHMAQNTDYDLILMDMMMPEMDGKEAASRILDSVPAPPPIIALTANVSSADQAECTAAGMSGFIGKPVRKHELIEELDRHLLPENRDPGRRPDREPGAA